MLRSAAAPLGERTCQIPWLGSSEICRLLGRYSHVIWAGDSLTRHMTMALYMLLQHNDYHLGGFPNVTVTDPHFHKEECTCDRQLSEDRACRPNVTVEHLFSFYDRSSQDKYCPSDPGEGVPPAPGITFSFVSIDPMYESSWICNPDPRPRFIFLQSGTHFSFNVAESIKHYWKPAGDHIVSETQECKYAVQDLLHVYYSAATGTAPANYDKYPTNHPNLTLEYNRQINEFMGQNYPMATYVDFFNMTLEAVTANRTSDGLHTLTDVNLMKAMVLLNVMRLTLPERAAEDPVAAHEARLEVARRFNISEGQPVLSGMGKVRGFFVATAGACCCGHLFTLPLFSVSARICTGTARCTCSPTSRCSWTWGWTRTCPAWCRTTSSRRCISGRCCRRSEAKLGGDERVDGL